MSRIKLDERLLAAADFVRRNSVVADIGTDHAYLIAYLLQQGIISQAIAADLRKGPLDNAAKTLSDCGQLENVRLLLSDGLDEIKKGDCNDIVIAGMGGILIKEILERTPWVYDKEINIIAQPMSHAEVLRGFFLENGFRILKEAAVVDGKHNYCVILAAFDGVRRSAEPWYTYVGELSANSDEASLAYIRKLVASLEKKLTALKKARVNDEENIEEIIKQITERIAEVRND